MKYFIYQIIIWFFTTKTIFAQVNKNDLFFEDVSEKPAITIADILADIQGYFFEFFIFAIIGVVFYMGYDYISGYGEEDTQTRVTKAFMALLIGLIIAPLAFIIVRLITTINL